MMPEWGLLKRQPALIFRIGKVYTPTLVFQMARHEETVLFLPKLPLGWGVCFNLLQQLFVLFLSSLFVYDKRILLSFH